MTFEEYPVHNSIRGWFGRSLYFEMQDNENIHCLTADLGYGLLNEIRDSHSDRFLNVGAAEQVLLGAGIGMTLAGKTCFCYSITSFLLYRPLEWIRNYLQHEGIPVRLAGSGLNDDYSHDGITHHTFDAKKVLKLFPRIKTYFPREKEEVPDMLQQMINVDEPSFICLRR